jgi:hypothetical protein
MLFDDYTKPATGRPTDYTEAKAAYIIDKLSKGIPLAEICREEGMPSATTVRAWAAKFEAFGVSYSHAREDGEDLLAISLRKVAHGDPEFSTGDVQRDKLKIETDFRLLKVFNPKKYGDTLKHTGDPNEPVVQKHSLEVSFVGNTNRNPGSV